jgi:hypothetical protein
VAQARPDAWFLAAAPATAAAAQQHRVPLIPLDAVTGLDLAIQGAHQSTHTPNGGRQSTIPALTTSVTAGCASCRSATP